MLHLNGAVFTCPNRGFHPLNPRPIPHRIIGVLRHFCNCLDIYGNANSVFSLMLLKILYRKVVFITKKADLNSVRIRIGGQGVEPPVGKMLA